jgi:hypothetical protein
MGHDSFFRSIVVAALVSVATTPSARADLPSFMFQLTQPGLVSTLDVNHVSNPVSSYQITGLGAGDVENAAGYDPVSNRMYYVNNLENVGRAQLDYLQFNSQGAVVSQNVVGTLPSPVTLSLGGDFYNGRFWISQNDTNMVYGFDPTNLSVAPIVLTLPTPTAHPSTAFNLGDLTFDDAAHTMFLAANTGGGEPTFLYEYALNADGTATLIASRNYTATNTDPMFNGIIFDQATGVLYGYAEATGQLYTIDTSTLMISSDVGSNPALFQFGDLAGFTPNAISAVPEPSSSYVVISVLAMLACCSGRIRRATPGVSGGQTPSLAL